MHTLSAKLRKALGQTKQGSDPHTEQILSPDTCPQDIVHSVLSEAKFQYCPFARNSPFKSNLSQWSKITRSIFSHKRNPWWTHRDNTLSPFPRIKPFPTGKSSTVKAYVNMAFSSGALSCVVSSVEQILKVTCNPFLLPFSPLENEKAKFSTSQSLSQVGLGRCVVGWGRGWISKEIRWMDIPERLRLPKQKTTPLRRKHFLFSWDLSTLPVEIKLQQLEEQELTCDHEVKSMERRSSVLQVEEENTEGGSVPKASEHLHKFWAAHLRLHETNKPCLL